MSVKIIRSILIILIIAVIGLYIYEIVVLKKDPMENLFRAVIVAAGCVIGIARLSGKGRRRSLDYYEAMYQKDIGNAFASAFLDRKKLLCAIRLYMRAITANPRNTSPSSSLSARRARISTLSACFWRSYIPICAYTIRR